MGLLAEHALVDAGLHVIKGVAVEFHADQQAAAADLLDLGVMDLL